MLAAATMAKFTGLSIIANLHLSHIDTYFPPQTKKNNDNQSFAFATFCKP
jgi:hypothetical protein